MDPVEGVGTDASSNRLSEVCKSVIGYRKVLQVRNGVGEGYSSHFHFLKCCADGNVAMAKVLIEFGVNPSEPWKYPKGFAPGSTALGIALDNQQTGIVEMLNEFLPPPPPVSEPSPTVSTSTFFQRPPSAENSLSHSQAIPSYSNSPILPPAARVSPPSFNSPVLPPAMSIARSSPPSSNSPLAMSRTPPQFGSSPLSTASPISSFRPTANPSPPPVAALPPPLPFHSGFGRAHPPLVRMDSEANSEDSNHSLSEHVKNSLCEDANRDSPLIGSQKKYSPSQRNTDTDFADDRASCDFEDDYSPPRERKSRYNRTVSERKATRVVKKETKRTQSIVLDKLMHSNSKRTTMAGEANTDAVLDNEEQLVTSAMGTAFFKIFVRFHSFMTGSQMSLEENIRMEGLYYMIQEIFIEGFPEALQDTAREHLADYMAERMKEKCDPIDVGDALLKSLTVMRSRFRTSRNSRASRMSIRGFISERDEEILKTLDVTHELYRAPVNLMDMDTMEIQEAFEIFVTFLQNETDDDYIEFLNRTKYLDVIVPLKEIFADLSLLHVACSLGRGNVILAMIAKGFDPLAKSRDGCYPFHFFVERGVQSYNVSEDAVFLDLIFADLMRNLPLDFVIPPDSNLGTAGDTLMHSAVQAMSVNLVKSLFENGLQFTKKNSANVTAMEMVVKMENEGAATEILDFMLSKMKKKQLLTCAEKMLELCLASQRRALFNMIIAELQQRTPTLYSLPGGFDVQELDPKLPKKHCLLLRSTPKDSLLDLCFTATSDSVFVSAVAACRSYCFSPQELAGFALQRLSNETYYSGVCRFLTIWATVTPTDFLESDIRPMVSRIISEIDSGPDIKSVSRSGKYPTECKEVLKSLLTTPYQEPNMSLIPFYHTSKEDSGRMRSISRKLMNVKLIPVIASHLLEWCIQVLDKISISELASHPLKSQSSSGPMTWIKVYTNMLNDVCIWTSIHILSINEAEGRARSIEYFIMLCDTLLKMHNYHLCLGMSMALQSPPIERLKASWALVGVEYVTRLKAFQELYSPSRNFAYYRKVIASCSSPSAVYLGVAMRDLIYLHDNTPSFVGRNQNSVNFYKLRGLYLCVQKWFATKSFREKLDPNEKISLYLSTIHNCQEVVSDHYLSYVSSVLEPPVSKKKIQMPEITAAGRQKLSLVVPNYDESFINPTIALRTSKETPSPQLEKRVKPRQNSILDKSSEVLKVKKKKDKS